MFIFDVETLGVESTAVVLSAALIHFDPALNQSYQDLLDNACFVKFNAKEQVSAGRTITKGTLDWWKDQHEYTRSVSFDPKPDDISVKDGFEQMYTYMSEFSKSQTQTMWARGSLDQMVIDSLAKRFDLEPLIRYNNWRDVRTAVDILYGTTEGYCDVEHPTFRRHEVIKHHPVHDCALDAMMLMYGKLS